MVGVLGPSLQRRNSAAAHKKVAAGQAALKGGSLAFTSSQYISLASDNDFLLGTGDWTLELWVRLTALPSSGTQAALFDFRPPGSNGVYPLAYVDSSGHVVYSVNSTTQITGSRTLSLNTWYNIAWSRNSSTLRQFIGGQTDGTWSGDSSNYLQGGLQIGRLGVSATGGITGNLTNFRLIKGNGLYPTSAYGAPNAPYNPTINSNTVLCLLASTNATAYVDSSPKNKTVTNHSTTWSNLTPF